MGLYKSALQGKLCDQNTLFFLIAGRVSDQQSLIAVVNC